MLGMAYAASIGGVATLIGTPPNAILAAAANEILDVQIGFIQWMGVGLPYRPHHAAGDVAPAHSGPLPRGGHHGGRRSHHPGGDRAALGPADKGEKLTGAVFVLTALAWVMRSEKTIEGITIPGIQTFAPNVSDATIAMTAAVVLFILPVNWRKGDFALDWRTARTIPWGVLVLFGGDLSLARAMVQSGLAAWIGGAVGALGAVPTIVLVGFVAAHRRLPHGGHVEHSRPPRWPCPSWPAPRSAWA